MRSIESRLHNLEYKIEELMERIVKLGHFGSDVEKISEKMEKGFIIDIDSAVEARRAWLKLKRD